MASTAKSNTKGTDKEIHMQDLVTQQVLVSFASLWEILLTIKIYLEKQIFHRLLLQKRLMAVSFRRVNYCCIVCCYCKPCKRHLKNLIAFKALRSFDWVKR